MLGLIGSITDIFCRYADRPVKVETGMPVEVQFNGRWHEVVPYDVDPEQPVLKAMATELAALGIRMHVDTGGAEFDFKQPTLQVYINRDQAGRYRIARCSLSHPELQGVPLRLGAGPRGLD